MSSTGPPASTEKVIAMRLTPRNRLMAFNVLLCLAPRRWRPAMLPTSIRLRAVCVRASPAERLVRLLRSWQSFVRLNQRTRPVCFGSCDVPFSPGARWRRKVLTSFPFHCCAAAINEGFSREVQNAKLTPVRTIPKLSNVSAGLLRSSSVVVDLGFIHFL